ncbi:hypothetical protein FQZ97_1030440 [compost metagenome]
MLSSGIAGRTSMLALASKLPLPRLPRVSSRVSRPARLLALRLKLLIACLSAVNCSRFSASCRSSLRSCSTGNTEVALQACWVGALGSGVLPFCPALATLCLTSAWRAALASLLSLVLPGR